MKGPSRVRGETRATARPRAGEQAKRRRSDGALPDLQRGLGNQATLELLERETVPAEGPAPVPPLTTEVELPELGVVFSAAKAKKKTAGGPPDKGVQSVIENTAEPAAGENAPTTQTEEGNKVETEGEAPVAEGRSMAEDESTAATEPTAEEESTAAQVPRGMSSSLPEEEETVQAKLRPGTSGSFSSAHSGGPAGIRAALAREPGSPLPASTRSRMEKGLGRPLSDVRIHTGSRARSLSSRFGARAFTVGQHVGFGAGEYRPGTLTGDALLAHELAHTAQQHGAGEASSAAAGGGYEALERDADEAAAQATAAIWAPGAMNGKLPRGPRRGSGLRLSRCGSSATVEKNSVKVGSHTTVNFLLDKKAPKRSNSASSEVNLISQSYKANVVEDVPGKQWKYPLDSIDSKGDMQLVYYTEDHYPAPTPMDDSGALTNVKEDNWQTIVTDLETNKTKQAGDWSAYKAEDVHEYFHWQKEWQVDAKREFAKAETEIDKLSVDKKDAATAEEAKAKLKPLATQEFKKAADAAIDAYDKRGDDDHDPPYQAQAPVIEALVKRVKDHAKTKGW